MTQFVNRKACGAAALAMMVATAGHAATFKVEFDGNVGVNWTGIVDTVADTLTINTWSVDADAEEAYWTPALGAFPLTFSAMTATRNPFDVPDAWDGTIGSFWGFIADVSKADTPWVEGTFTGNASRLGWGIQEDNIGTIRTDAQWGDEFGFTFVPYTETFNRRIEAASLTVTPTSTGPAVIPVPASLPLLAGALIGIGAMVRRSRRTA